MCAFPSWPRWDCTCMVSLFGFMAFLIVKQREYNGLIDFVCVRALVLARLERNSCRLLAAERSSLRLGQTAMQYVATQCTNCGSPLLLMQVKQRRCEKARSALARHRELQCATHHGPTRKPARSNDRTPWGLLTYLAYFTLLDEDLSVR